MRGFQKLSVYIHEAHPGGLQVRAACSASGLEIGSYLAFGVWCLVFPRHG